MKTHPHLLVRDALAACFVAAAAGDAEASMDVSRLATWAEGGGAPPDLRAEDGAPLFEGGALAPRFEPLADYVRDRALRFAAACQWLAKDGTFAEPLERARAAWDAGLFFEVHEIVEPVWLDARGLERDLLQGVIMAGAALHHLANGNLAGARGLLADAARRLDAPDPEGRFDFAGFAAGLARLGRELESGAVSAIGDIAELPVLERRGRTSATGPE